MKAAAEDGRVSEQGSSLLRVSGAPPPMGRQCHSISMPSQVSVSVSRTAAWARGLPGTGSRAITLAASALLRPV
jgi:hypothetical protein